MNIVPKPLKTTLLEGETTFSADTKIVSPIDVIVKELNFVDYEKAVENSAVFQIADTEYDYELIVDGNIKVLSKTNEGLFHGSMTLKQLVFDGYFEGVATLKNCHIQDKPRFEYRSFMLDIVRHFFDKRAIIKLIDILSLVKINNLHLHLSDNQGYRLESNVFPELNEKANVRKSTRGDGIPVGGYLTKADVKEIVDYAGERFVNVVPEIDLPGHTLFMLVAKPETGCTGEQFQLAVRYGIDNRILCAGNEDNYDIIAKLIAEIAEMFPSKYFHIGGDEVPKTQWQKCEKCNALMLKEGFDNYEQLQGYFTNRVINILKQHDKTAIVWNEALYSNMLDDSAVCQYWADGKGANAVRNALKNGRKMFVSKNFPYYLDYPHGINNLKRVYKFEPLSCFDGQGEENILGVESPLWTEWVADEEKLHHQAFPRAIAVAETGWTERDNKKYKDFVERLYNVLGILEAYEIGYEHPTKANPNIFKALGQGLKFLFAMLDLGDRKAVKNAIDAGKARKTK
jgi:hexosaminidase